MQTEPDPPLRMGGSIAIGIAFDGENPKVFTKREPRCRSISSTSLPGCVPSSRGFNASELTLIPHCHGTHTETVAHLDIHGTTIDQLQPPIEVPCTLITVASKPFAHSTDSYPYGINTGEQIIDRAELQCKLEHTAPSNLFSLAIRTLPNDESKKNSTYNASDTYPYFTTEAMSYIFALGVRHLLVDTPSIDRFEDGGLLSNHRCFWNINREDGTIDRSARSFATITELIYVPNTIPDGSYYLSLCYPMLKTDAVPSWPLLVSEKPER